MSAKLGTGKLPITCALRSANDKLRHEAADTVEALYDALEDILECAFDGPAYDAAVAALKQARGEA